MPDDQVFEQIVLDDSVSSALLPQDLEEMDQFTVGGHATNPQIAIRCHAKNSIKFEYNVSRVMAHTERCQLSRLHVLSMPSQ